MPFIESVIYGSLTGQANDMIGFDVAFGADPPTPADFTEAINAMASTHHRSKAIRLAIPPGGANDLGIEAFCRKWKVEAGYFLIAMHDGQLSYRWEQYLDYLIVNLTAPKWPVYRCNELHFDINLGPEPAIPHTPSPKLVAVRGGADDTAVWKWLAEARNPWHLYLEGKRPLVKVVYKAGM
jgi:hypothetical protein